MSNLVYAWGRSHVIYGDSLEAMRWTEPGSYDAVWTDPPQNRSRRRITNPVDELYRWNRSWLVEAKRCLKENGALWVAATDKNLGSLLMACESVGYRLLNLVTWERAIPAPNTKKREFTKAAEYLIYATPADTTFPRFDYADLCFLNDGVPMKDIWGKFTVEKEERTFGKHPQQTPLSLVNRCFIANSLHGKRILDPFAGYGTTGLAAWCNGSDVTLIDSKMNCIAVTLRRLKEFG